MLSTHWEEVKSVFEAALQRDEGEQDAFVWHRCGEDHEMAREVLRLLAADRESSKFFEEANIPTAKGFYPEPEPGLLQNEDVLCGRFRILAYLGEGGMGQVYKAVDLELRQEIAIKAIRREIADAPGVLSRFKREVNVARKVTHPNVCRTFDLETHAPSEEKTERLRTSITFITMELLVGETLADRLRRAGPLPPDQVRACATQISAALKAAHNAGIVHCDLKPSNIFITDAEGDPRIVVTDFGIAKVTLSQDQGPLQLTVTGMAENGAAGTPFYMAPEQFETGDCSAASDMYSFGLVLFEALTARRLSPFRRSYNEIQSALGAPGPNAITGVLHPIEPVWTEIIARCVQPDPTSRFESAQLLLDRLAGGPGHQLAESPVDPNNSASAREIGPGLWRSVHLAWKALPLSARAIALSLSMVGLIVLASRLSPPISNESSSSDTIATSVAVLPVIDRGNDSQMNALAEGITLNLTNALAQVSGLRVPSQKAVSDLGNVHDNGSIRRKLNVETVVNGSIVSAGGDSVLQIELVDVRTGYRLWGQSYTRKEMESPSLADDIAQEVAYQLRTRSDKGLPRRSLREHSKVPAAEKAFAQGQGALAEHTYAGFERSVKYFQQAIDADPNYAEAMAELSRSYAVMAINNGRPEAPLALLNQAGSTARHALRIDSTLAAAYTSLAQVAILKDYNWDEAEENFKRAEEVEPDYVPAHLSYALHLLTARGRFAEARAQLAYADKETPKTLGTSLTEAVVAHFSGKYEDSLHQIEQIRNQFHTSAVAIEIEASDYMALHSPDKALKVLAEAPPDPSAPRASRDALRAIALAQTGQRKKAIEELNRLEKSDPHFESSYYIAALCAQLGYRDKAMDYLEKSRQDRITGMLFLAVDPLMEPLRSDPRFKSVLSSLNWP